MSQTVSRKSIENFKSALSNGGVRPTMFTVDITFPEVINKIVGTAAEKTTFLVKASQMPGSTIGVVEVPFRGRKLKVSGDRTFADWETTIINDGDFTLRKAMEKWSEYIQNHNYALGARPLDKGDATADRNKGVGNDSSGYFGTAQVRQLDRQGNQLRLYQFNGIWPSVIEPISLDFGNVDTIEEYNVTFCVQYWHAAGRDAGDIDASGENNPFKTDSAIVKS